LDTTFSNEQESRTLDEVLGSWIPAGTITAMKQSATNRNAYVRSQIPLQLTASSPLFFVSGFPQTATATAQIFGFSDVINTRTILVNNSTSVWSAWEGRWTNNAVALQPGINHVLVQALGTNGLEFARTNIDIWYNVAGTNVSGTIASSTTWNAANGPFNISGNIVVPAGVTLTIAPGATIFMGAGTTFTVHGRLLAPGTDLAHVRFTRVPGGGNWGSLDFINTTNESRLEYVDIDSCAGTTIGGHAAKVHVNGGSIVFFDHLEFANTPAQQYISFDASSFVVQNSTFPTYPWAISAPEMLHGVNGIPANGYGIFRGNYFGHTFGFNDTIDFTGGQRPNAVLHIINNVFDGAGDDHLDLDSADAWIEGNIFMHAHRDPNRTDNPLDTSSAISGGVDFAGQFPEWTVINNLFYDVDHAFLTKGGGSPGAGRVIFVNNTLVHVAKESGSGLTNDIAAFDFTDNAVPLPDPSYGAGAYIAGNIIWDVPQLVANYNPSNHTVIFENNILPMPWTGPGSNNIVADPRLNLGLITTVTNADWKTVKAAFMPRSGSPAFGAGLGGHDAGGLNPPGLRLAGGPTGVTTNRSATLTVSPGGAFYWGSVVPPYLWGYTHYKWRVDNGPWSPEISITNSPTFTVSNLGNGPHTVSVAGKSDTGYYQDDPFLYPTNSTLPAHVTSRFWFVVTNPPGRVVLNEVLARNVNVFDHEDSTPDVIELFNPGVTAVDLGGKGITDDLTNHYKFLFPANTTLGPGQYLLVFADSLNNRSGLHLGFGLNQSGDVIYLFDSPANGGALLDSIKFGLQLENLSIGRLPDNSWSLNQPTIGAANIAYPVGDISLLKINEWLTDGTIRDDFIEIYNRDTLPVNIGNAWLSDTPESAPLRHQVSPLSFLAANSYFPFLADGNVDQGAEHVSFQLSPDGGSILLSTSNGTLIDLILYGPQSTDVSEGRSPNGAETRAFFALPTPGAPNPLTGNATNVVTETINLFGLNKVWKYNQTDVLDGINWNSPDYDDSTWSQGAGLLAVEDCGCLPPILTPLSFGRITYYFRTTFVLNTNPAGMTLNLTTYIDDGAAIYVNGSELMRVRMPGGTLFYNTLANSPSVGDASLETFSFPATNLVEGTNLIAVEVHQQSAGSSDITWGLALDVSRSTTNLVQLSLALNEVMGNNLSYTNADGSISDWIEILNPGTVPVDVSDMSLSDDVAQPRRWVFPAGVSIPAGGYLTVKFDPNAPASTNAAANLNTGFGFSSGGDEALLFDKVSRGGALLDSVEFGLQAADFTIGRVPNGSGAWALTLPTEGSVNIPVAPGDVSALRVNEWMADPPSGDDDYFELYNPNAQPVALGGLFLTDNLNNRTQYRIPNLSFIGVGVHGFTEFQADGNPENGGDHTNFRLSAGGESIGLFGTDGLTLIDSITFGGQQQSVSEGRFPDGATNIVRFPRTPTPGEANFLPFNDVLINEALTHSDLPLEDAIELFNPTATPINIGGWYLSDSQIEPRKFRIPDHTIIPPGGFVVFYEYQFNPTFLFPSFSLSSVDGDEIFLSLTDTNGNLTGYRSSVDFGGQVNGVSFGRYETSIGSDFVAMTARTLGADAPATVQEFRTGQGKTNAAPRIGPIVINEIHYHPPELGTNDNTRDEFIELYNASGSAVPLYAANHGTNTWHLRGGVDFDFPTNTSIPAGGYLLIVGFDPNTNAAALAEFRGVYGISPSVPIVGPWEGRLANGDDEIRLNQPDEPELNDVPYVLVERVLYSDSAPWPSAADGNLSGTGISLQRVVALNFGNDPVNWIAGTPTPAAANGAAATPPPAITLQPTNRTVAAGAPVTFVAAASGSPPLQYQWRFNGVDVPNATNASYTVFGAQFAQAGGYAVRVVNVAGAALSATAVLAIQSAPQILFHPQDRNVATGGLAVFSVGARGTAPLEYRWFKDGAAVGGATQPTLVLNNVQAPNLGSYFVIVSNAFGSITSSVASLQISTPPSIVSHPTNQTVIVGQTVTLAGSVAGSPPMLLQWYFNGLPLAGANSASLIFSDVQPSRSGTYSLFASNAVGTAFSSNATLIVIVPPTVTIVATDPNAAETGLNPGAFTITRANGSSNVALTVNFVIEGTAQNGADYQSIPASALILPGTNFVVLSIAPFDDAVVEPNETVVLRLLASTGYLVGSPSNATVTIADNDNLPPVVTITTPTNNTFVPITPTNLLLAATATDPNPGQSVRVGFYFGTNFVGEVLTPPYQFTWTNPPSGSNLLVAVATDNLGLSTTSAPIALSINGPPAVAITSPGNGANVPGGANLLITAAATDTNGGVAQVDFYVNGAFLSTATGSPYSATITNPPQAAYQTFAVARDTFGLSATSAVVQFFVVPPSTNFADMFVNRGFIGGYTNFKTASNVGATKEQGEPNHYAPNSGGRSVWLSWIAPGSGVVTIDLVGSSYD
ncbi:MAG TPA: lamin tail domain-containing protein, partial [Methylomirabilota bacterium]|nr:lamin tail domain-containing protein [Methylomirabilota bacterium]